MLSWARMRTVDILVARPALFFVDAGEWLLARVTPILRYMLRIWARTVFSDMPSAQA